jgi:hypothetical protein
VRDLVDLKLTCKLYVSLKYGAVPPNDEQLELRGLHAKAVGDIVGEIEAEAMDKLAEVLGYDSETLQAKLQERDVQRAQDKKAEEDGRALRQKQRSGQG